MYECKRCKALTYDAATPPRLLLRESKKRHKCMGATLSILRIVTFSSPNNVRNAKGGTYRRWGGSADSILDIPRSRYSISPTALHILDTRNRQSLRQDAVQLSTPKYRMLHPERRGILTGRAIRDWKSPNGGWMPLLQTTPVGMIPLFRRAKKRNETNSQRAEGEDS